MRAEQRSAAAIGVAVFIAGAVLLGLEIASSRVLAPFFGSSLYVWGALIGVVLAGLSLGYWLGGMAADREPTPALFVGVLGLAALLVLAIPFVDGWVLDQVVELDPGPRLNPLLATIVALRRSRRRPRHRLADRGQAPRPLARPPRPHGRPPVRDLHSRLDRRHLRDSLLADPRARNRPAARRRRRCADARRGVRCARRAARSRLRRSRRDRGGELRRRPLAGSGEGRNGRRLRVPELVAGLSPARRRRGGASARRPQRCPVGVRGAPRQGHAISPSRGRPGRDQPLPPLRQLLPERDVARPAVPHALRVHGLPPARARLQPRREAGPLRRPRRRLRSEADVARLSGPAPRRGRARRRGRRRRPPLLRAPAGRPRSTSRSRTAGGISRRTRGRGTRSSSMRSTRTRSRSTWRPGSSWSSREPGSPPAG